MQKADEQTKAMYEYEMLRRAEETAARQDPTNNAGIGEEEQRQMRELNRKVAELTLVSKIEHDAYKLHLNAEARLVNTTECAVYNEMQQQAMLTRIAT